MTDQRQCPNCGGYKVILQEEVEGLVPLTPEETAEFFKPGKANLVLGILFFGIPGVFLIILGVVEIILGITGASDGPNSCGCCFGPLWLSPFIYILWNDYYKTYREYREKGFITRRKKLGIMRYYCNLCGYRWEWRQGEPWPEVKVRPDLVVKGEQRLEEEAAAAEEEERKRKERDFIMLSQRYGKK